jgi:hypothetical protein
MDKYASRVRTPDENLSFLEEHPELLHEHCMGYLLMEALQLGMDDKKAAMKRVVKQKYHIKSLLDFAEARARPPRVCARACDAAASQRIPSHVALTPHTPALPAPLRQDQHPRRGAPLLHAPVLRRGRVQRVREHV